MGSNPTTPKFLPCQVDPTDLGDPHGPVAVKGHAAPPAEGGPPEPQESHPSAPHHPTALPVHGGSSPHGAAVAGPRHPHPKLPPPHGGEHAWHPAMLLQHPRLPPANAPTHPGADLDNPRVTHVPAEPRQRHHTATCTYTGTNTHRSPGKARAHARCPNSHPRPHYSQDQVSDARPTSPGPPAVPHSPLLRLRLQNLHHHNHLICHHHRVLVQHSTPQAAGETSQTGPQTGPHREQPRRRQGPRPNEARAHSPAETQDRRQAATRARRRAATATRSQT